MEASDGGERLANGDVDCFRTFPGNMYAAINSRLLSAGVLAVK